MFVIKHDFGVAIRKITDIIKIIVQTYTDYKFDLLIHYSEISAFIAHETQIRSPPLFARLQ